MNKSNNINNTNPLVEIKSGRSNLIKSMKLIPIPIKKKVKFLLKKEKLNEDENDENSFDFLKKINKSNNNKYLTLDNDEKTIGELNNEKNIYSLNSKNLQIENINSLNCESSNRNNIKIENKFRYNSIDNYSNRHKITLKKTPKIDSKNKIFINILKERENKIISPIEIFNRNKKYLNKMLRKKSSGRFCLPFKGDYDKKKEILFNPSKLNHYEELVNEMRKKYINDKNNYYSYSEKALTLSFPMVEGFRNEEYLKYIENKSKWIVDKDFDRYKQPEREKVFFPRIIKEI